MRYNALKRIISRLNKPILTFVVFSFFLATPMVGTSVPHTVQPFHNSSAIPASIHKIKHVIVVIEENQAFDTIFGTYPYGYRPIINNVTNSVMRPTGLYTSQNQLNTSNGVLSNISIPRVPWFNVFGSAHPYYANGNSTVDPYEGWSSYHGDYWFDTENGFYYYSGPQSMAYFSYEQVGILWDYAEEYSISDNYFAPVMGFTEPNRIAYLTGAPPDFYSDSATNVIPFNDSIMSQLSRNNVSWNYYVYGLSGGVPWPLDAFTGSSHYQSHYRDISSFDSALKNNTLPSVSWLMFLGGNTSKYDMHPPYNILSGSQKLASVIDNVMKSNEWNSTAIFVTFDEGGGYYDQITPPAINHFGLGQRIPLLVISPYAREAYVGNSTISGYSLLGFIDKTFNLSYITSTVAQSNTQGLMNMFNFSRPPRTPVMIYPNNWTYPMKLQYPVHYGYVAKVTDHTGYAVVYSAPELNWLLPIELSAFAAIVVSLKFKKVVYYPVIAFPISLGISAYINSYYNIYSFISEYYVFSSLIGVLIALVLLYRKLRKDGKIKWIK